MAVLSALCRRRGARGAGHESVRAIKKVSAPWRRAVVCLPPLKVEALRGQMPTDIDALLVSVLAYAGLRPGEALALTWGDVGERTLRVDKSLSLGEERETKTRRDRSVRLLKPLADALKAMRVALGRIPSASERIFPLDPPMEGTGQTSATPSGARVSSRMRSRRLVFPRSHGPMTATRLLLATDRRGRKRRRGCGTGRTLPHDDVEHVRAPHGGAGRREAHER